MTSISPKGPADCLAHCRIWLPDTEYDMAVLLISLLVETQKHAATVAAIEESHRRAMAIIDRHLSAEKEPSDG
ncbi:MAG: hypothetical protein IVW56_09520 [Candidatus Binataceae bacterium]|nr:hypothetical protein [Candidatus Binataceae bacterium]